MCCYWCCCCCCCCRYLATYNPILFALCRTQTSTFQASGSWMRVTVSVCMFRRGITSIKINKKSIKTTRRTAGAGSLPNGAQRLHFPFLARALQGLAGSWQKKIERSDLFFFSCSFQTLPYLSRPEQVARLRVYCVGNGIQFRLRVYERCAALRSGQGTVGTVSTRARAGAKLTHRQLYHWQIVDHQPYDTVRTQQLVLSRLPPPLR